MSAKFPRKGGEGMTIWNGSLISLSHTHFTIQLQLQISLTAGAAKKKKKKKKKDWTGSAIQNNKTNDGTRRLKVLCVLRKHPR